MSEHRASGRGGWGIRLHGSKVFPHPDGSELISYSLGDVLAYDSEEEAEVAARPIRQSSSYSRVTVERVVKGQRQASHIDARHAIELRRARAEALEEAVEAVCRLMRDRDPIYTHDLQQAVDAILALQAGKGSGR